MPEWEREERLAVEAQISASYFKAYGKLISLTGLHVIQDHVFTSEWLHMKQTGNPTLMSRPTNSNFRWSELAGSVPYRRCEWDYKASYMFPDEVVTNTIDVSLELLEGPSEATLRRLQGSGPVA